MLCLGGAGSASLKGFFLKDEKKNIFFFNNMVNRERVWTKNHFEK